MFEHLLLIANVYANNTLYIFALLSLISILPIAIFLKLNNEFFTFFYPLIITLYFLIVFMFSAFEVDDINYGSITLTSCASKNYNTSDKINLFYENNKRISYAELWNIQIEYDKCINEIRLNPSFKIPDKDPKAIIIKEHLSHI